MVRMIARYHSDTGTTGFVSTRRRCNQESGNPARPVLRCELVRKWQRHDH
jgi:hypothetical protein